MASDWSIFQQYVWDVWWVPNFPPEQGWNGRYQKPLLNGAVKVDFASWKGNLRVVGDAKDKASLTVADVLKLAEDAGIFRASGRILVVAADTDWTETVDHLIQVNGIDVVRSDWRAAL